MSVLQYNNNNSRTITPIAVSQSRESLLSCVPEQRNSKQNTP